MVELVFVHTLTNILTSVYYYIQLQVHKYLSELGKIIATSRVNYTYTTRLPDEIMKLLEVVEGDEIGFFYDEVQKSIILSLKVTEGLLGLKLKGSSKLTKSGHITIRDQARAIMGIKGVDEIAYIENKYNNRISIHRLSDLKISTEK